MSEAQIPESLPSLLIPMNGRPWLIPNIVVAEVIPLRQPDRPGHGPEWLLGWINWREQDLPLISYEKLNESGQVAIGPDGQGFGLAVTLAVTLPGLDEDDAKALVDKAHEVCPYSNATRGNIPVELEVYV